MNESNSKLKVNSTSLFLPTTIGSTVPKCQTLFIRLVVGTAVDIYIGKTKGRLHDRKTELRNWSQLKWDYFDILGRSNTDYKKLY